LTSSFVSGAHAVRSASRGHVSADTRSDQIGFRVARTLHRPRHLDEKVIKGPRFIE
jgi:hypothetical protein